MKLTMILSVIISAVLFSNYGYSAKLYKWVDGQGNISYQDYPQPQNGKVLEQKNIQSNTIKPTNSDAGKLVTIYTISDCVSCEKTIKKLKQHKVRYQEKSLQNRAAQERILAKTDSLLAPTLIIDDIIITDISDDSLNAALNAAGYSLGDQ